MACSCTNEAVGQLFALIGFIPDALGEYLNNLRQQLVPGCPFRSHVTLLPPRLLTGAPVELITQLHRQLAHIESFEITLGEVEVFASSNVVYLGIAHGRTEIERLHELLAIDKLAYSERFPFHPHITLAQDFDVDDQDEIYLRAKAVWTAWKRERSFVVDRLSFVQGVDLCTWSTLEEYDLRKPLIR